MESGLQLSDMAAGKFTFFQKGAFVILPIQVLSIDMARKRDFPNHLQKERCVEFSLVMWRGNSL